MNAPLAITRETTAINVIDTSDLPVPASSELTPMQMVYQLIARGASIESVKEMMALSKELADDEARKAFIAARAAAKLEIPVILKNKHVGFESRKAGASATDYWHEDLGEIARTIDPILGKHGLSYEFVPDQSGNALKITCVLSHKGGYSKEYPLSAGNDSSGNKNSIQGVGSTATYLSRYTLKMALGLAASRDDDGALADQTPAEASTITEQQIMNLTDLLEATKPEKDAGGHRKAFLAYMKVGSISEIPAREFQRAADAINSTRARP